MYQFLGSVPRTNRYAHMCLLVLALRKCRQEDQEFELTLGYIVSLGSALNTLIRYCVS